MGDESWLSELPGIHTIRNGGSPITARRQLSLTGDISARDNAAEGQTELVFASSGVPARSYAWKASCRLATTANHSLSGLADIDGVTPVANDRVLVWSQTIASENGIYVAAVGAWTRASDFESQYNAVPGCVVAIEEGATYAGEPFYLLGPGPIVVGTSSMTWRALTSNDAKSLRGVDFASGVSTASAGEVLTESSGDYDATHLVDANVSSSAAIAVSKLAAGQSPELLMSATSSDVQWRAPWVRQSQVCSVASLTIEFDPSRIQDIVLCANTTITVEAPHDGEFFLLVAQDGVGGWSLTLSNSSRVLGSTALGVAASGKSLVRFIRRNGVWSHSVDAIYPAGSSMDLVQMKSGLGSLTYDSATTSGNLLVVVSDHDAEPAPTGFSVAVEVNATLGKDGAIFWKVADGTETLLVLGAGRAHIAMEFSTIGTPVLHDAVGYIYGSGEWKSTGDRTETLTMSTMSTIGVSVVGIFQELQSGGDDDNVPHFVSPHTEIWTRTVGGIIRDKVGIMSMISPPQAGSPSIFLNDAALSGQTVVAAQFTS